MISYITRGDVYYAELPLGKGSEQSGCRPVVIIQNNMGNYNSPTVIVAAITSSYKKPILPTHVIVETGMPKKSIVLLEQITTIDKQRIKNYITTLPDSIMEKIDSGIKVSLNVS